MPGPTMGNAAAKGKRKWGRKKSPASHKNEDGDDQWTVGPVGKDENLLFQEMKRLVREEPNVFILNNLIMSLQLFTNYNEEIEKARDSLTTRENELNEKLIPDKRLLMPDVLRKHFNGRIRFTSYCKDEQTVEPLRPIQMYLVYDNVFVSEVEDSRDYSTAEDASVEYTFVLKEADHKGYVRLEQTNKPLIKRNQNSTGNPDLSSIVENRDEAYSEDESVYGTVPARRTNGATSMPNLLDQDMYYEGHNSNSTQNLQSNGVTKLNGRFLRRRPTPTYIRKPSSASSSSSGYTTCNYSGLESDNESYLSQSRLHYLDSGKRVDPSEIPSRCFKRVTYMYNGRVYNRRKEQKPLTSQQRRIREEKLTHNYDVVYVNGHRFAKHFYEVFKSQLAGRMDFDGKEVENAKRCNATVRLEKIDYLTTKNHISIEQYEVIPCFASHWPQWARRWLDRQRGDWPTEEALDKVRTYDCYLVPESLRQALPNSESSHPFWQLDWCLAFPKAEKYLETCLSPSQMAVYTVALMMHKIFIKTVSSTFGLDTRHIRNMIFWMAEKQPKWSEHELGKSMIMLLERLHKHVQLRKLSDYFMDDRNVFASVNTDDLLHSQKQLKRIVDNPVMFVFHAMEKIHYEEADDAYPRLDFKQLLRILTVHELYLVNTSLEVNTQEQQQQVYNKPVEKGFWRQVKQTNQYYEHVRKMSGSTLINPKRISDTIIEIQERCEPLVTPSGTRLAHLCMFFAEHFLEMAKYCHQLGAADQKQVYLNQTKLLALMLFEIPDYKKDSRGIVEAINKLRAVNTVSPPTNMGPETPKRNVDQMVFMKDRATHGRPSTVMEETETNNNNNVIEAEVYSRKLAMKVNGGEWKEECGDDGVLEWL